MFEYLCDSSHYRDKSYCLVSQYSCSPPFVTSEAVIDEFFKHIAYPSPFGGQDYRQRCYIGPNQTKITVLDFWDAGWMDRPYTLISFQIVPESVIPKDSWCYKNKAEQFQKMVVKHGDNVTKIDSIKIPKFWEHFDEIIKGQTKGSVIDFEVRFIRICLQILAIIKEVSDEVKEKKQVKMSA